MQTELCTLHVLTKMMSGLHAMSRAGVSDEMSGTIDYMPMCEMFQGLCKPLDV